MILCAFATLRGIAWNSSTNFVRIQMSLAFKINDPRYIASLSFKLA